MIPVLKTEGNNIPETWEKSLQLLYERGTDIATQYDLKHSPPSKDATMILIVKEPLSEPMIHLDMPGGFEDLQEYVMEVCDGIKDHWVRDPNDPDDKRWEYTYHNRIFNYNNHINQIENMIKQLGEASYTRRAQCITWNVETDSNCYDPPCFCAGSLVLTPQGYKPIEKLTNGESVYSLDSNTGLLPDKISNYFTKQKECLNINFETNSNIQVSTDQLLMTQDGWKKAKELTLDDCVLQNCSSDPTTITDTMILGYLHGDGWLSSGYSHTKQIKRYDICFSIHPKADPSWIYHFINNNSNNKIVISKRFMSSKIAPNGGISKKIKVHDKDLWNKFEKLGAPVGKKCGNINVKLTSNQEKKDFLIGVFSAEGCITKSKHRPSIQLGMNWHECVDFISNILSQLNIKHSIFINNNTKIIQINQLSEIEKFVELCDFRLDSRKQAKYIRLLLSLKYNKQIYQQHLNHIHNIQNLHKSGVKQSELRKIKPFNPRMLKNDYVPVIRCKKFDRQIVNNGIFVKINNISNLGMRQVYDFEIEHKEHTIIVNGVVAHNCLQSIWCRIIDHKLCMNVRFRSNDAYKAAFMNIFALVQLQKRIADKLNVSVGRYCHIADSYHIYGKDIPEFKSRFLNAIQVRTFDQRTVKYCDVKDMMDESIPIILSKVHKC